MLFIEGDIQEERSLKIPEFWPTLPPPLVRAFSFLSTPYPHDTFVLPRTHRLPLNFYTCEI